MGADGVRFRKYGRTLQMRVETAADLAAVPSVDEALWVATAAPIAAYRCDPKFAEYLDADRNGRVNSDDLKTAIRWLLARMADPSGIVADTDVVPLRAIREDCPEGASLAHSARYVLESSGREGQGTIALADLRPFMAGIEGQPLSGDGIVHADSTGDPRLGAFLKDVGATLGTVNDATGKPGITEKTLVDFLAAARGHLDWRALAALPEDGSPTERMPYGADTPALFELVRVNRSSIELFFRLCRAVAFDPRAASRVAGVEAGLQNVDPAKPELLDEYFRSLPLASPAPGMSLPLAEDRINPLHRGWARDFREKVLPRVLGESRDDLTEQEWGRIKGAFAAYEAYLGAKAGAAVEKLGPDRLAACLDPGLDAAARELFTADREVAAVLLGAKELEKLLLYHRYLMRFANNFVSFPELYDTQARALFETGSVVMDGRWFNLAARVDDVAQHSTVAKAASLLIMYVEVTGAPNEKFTVAVPVTSGTKGNLVVGKRGVFFDTNGREFDARVVQVIENPVSMREAIVLPFVRLWALLEGKIESWSGSAEKQLQTEFNKGIPLPVPGAPPVAPPPAPPPKTGEPPAPTPGGRGGLLVGVGVATAALGSSFAFITKTFSNMDARHVWMGFIGAAFAVLFPISLIAFLKLRRQDLSPLLEGCGWAVNARMRLTRAQRRQFTRKGIYPPATRKRMMVRLVARIVLYSVLAVLLALAAVRLWKLRQDLLPKPAPAAAGPTATPGAPVAPAPAPPPAAP